MQEASIAWTRRCLLAGAVLVVAVPDLRAAEGDPRLAIRGYDPVAYFTPGRPTPGSPDISYVWDGARWQFADGAHRDLFARDPDAYAPQYGGYCAMGMAGGARAEVDPQQWTIVNGKLYLSYNREGLDTFKENTAAHIAEADRNWAAMHQP